LQEKTECTRAHVLIRKT